MEIRNINSTSQFTGIYKLPNVDAATIKEISSHMNLVARVTNRPVYLFGGNHPLEGSVVKIIRDTVPECRQYSYNWLVQNAKNHGITLPEANKVDAWVITSNDIDIMKGYLDKSDSLINKKKTFLTVLKEIFLGSEQPGKELPSYLRALMDLSAKNEKMVEAFQEIIATKKVVEANNLQKLVQSILQER
jgi:hypothetical protein